MFFLLFSVSSGSFQGLTFEILPDLTALVLIGTLIPMLFFLKAIDYIGNVKASLFTILDPATTILLGSIFLKESFNLLQYIGFGFMALSILILQVPELHKMVTKRL